MKRTKKFCVGCEWIGLLCIYYKYFIEFLFKILPKCCFYADKMLCCCIERKK